MVPWCTGYHYCATLINWAWTEVLRRFTSCSRCVGYSRLWGSLTIVPARNKAKLLLPVIHTTKTIHHHHKKLYSALKTFWQIFNKFSSRTDMYLSEDRLNKSLKINSWKYFVVFSKLVNFFQEKQLVFLKNLAFPLTCWCILIMRHDVPYIANLLMAINSVFYVKWYYCITLLDLFFHRVSEIHVVFLYKKTIFCLSLNFFNIMREIREIFLIFFLI